jgi:hypothetical protein
MDRSQAPHHDPKRNPPANQRTLARYSLTEQNIDNIQKDPITLTTTGRSPSMKPESSAH